MGEGIEDTSNINQYHDPGDSAELKAAKATPVAKQYVNTREVIESAIRDEETTFLNATVTVASQIANLGLEAAGGYFNPLGLLVSVGLDFALTFVKDLDRIITWLSGNPGQMTQLKERWGQFKDVLLSLREDVDQAWESSLSTSQSPTADAARDKVSGMAAALAGCAAEVAQIEEHLGHAHMLSKTIFEVVKTLLAALVEQLIIHGLLALALAYPTAGASITKFLMFAARKSAMQIAETSLRITLARGIGRRLMVIGQDVLQATFRQKSRDLLIWGGAAATSVTGSIFTSGGPGAGTGVPGGSSNPASGMAAYIDVDPAEFDVGAEKLRSIKTNADLLSSAIESDTDTDYWTWGVACIGYVDGYNQQRTEIAGDVALISPALEGNATRFNEVAANYRDADEQAATELDKSGGES